MLRGQSVSAVKGHHPREGQGSKMARNIKFYHNNKSIYTAQNLIWRDNSKCVHAHTYTQAPAHTSTFLSFELE